MKYAGILKKVFDYFNKDEVTVPQDLYEEVFNATLLDESSEYKNGVKEEEQPDVRKVAVAFAEWTAKGLWSTVGELWYDNNEDNPITSEDIVDLYLNSLKS